MTPAPATSRTTLASLTTIGVGGPAGRLVEARTVGALIDAVRDADLRGEPVLVLGGGSNVVISDAGFAGVVILVRTSGIERQAGRLRVAAGHSWDALVDVAVSKRLAGIECLAGIPGLVGATPVQNVGAYGQDVSEVIARVDAYDRVQRKLRSLTGGECGFGYRTSRFKAEPDRWVVTAVELELRESAHSDPVRYADLSRALDLSAVSNSAEPANPPTAPTAPTAPIAAVREAVLALRRAKGMVLDPADPDTASCGSFFTNPVLNAASYAQLAALTGADVPGFPAPGGRFKVSAGWLIEQAGFGRGFGAGRARLSTKHPLAVTNRGGASAADVIALARTIRDGVRDRLGIILVIEPVLVGERL